MEARRTAPFLRPCPASRAANNLHGLRHPDSRCRGWNGLGEQQCGRTHLGPGVLGCGSCGSSAGCRALFRARCLLRQSASALGRRE